MNHNILLIYETLLDRYGHQGWWPVLGLRNSSGRDERGYTISSASSGPRREPFLGESSRLEIVLGAILTQNTSWVNAVKALDNLLTRGMINLKKILDIDERVLAEIIKPSGYYNQKARKIKIIASFLEEGGYLECGNIPNRFELLNLWGVGEETADSILLYAYGIPVFVVDAYTRRIFKRLAILDGSESYQVIAKLFTKALGKNTDLYGEYHALIVRHSVECCRKKPDCSSCMFNCNSR